MKKEKNIFTIFALLAFANGIAFLLFAEKSIELLGGQAAGISLLMTRYYGAIALGCGLAIWLLRDSQDQKVKKAILLGIFVSMLISAVVGIYGSLNNWFENFDWLFILIDSTLSVWSAYLLFLNHKRS